MKFRTRVLLVVVTLTLSTLPAAGQSRVRRPASVTNEVYLACGDDLQAAINAAAGETVIYIAHLQSDGVTRCNWNHNYSLPWRADNNYVTIRTDGELPPYGTRTQPGDSYLALITATREGTGLYNPIYTAQTGLTAQPGHPLHGYRLLGLEITTPADTSSSSYFLVGFSAYTTTSAIQYADIPHGFDVEHCYIHGPNMDVEIDKGVILADDTTIIDNTISQITSNGFESNAIWGCLGSGNWVVENNDLEASGENFFVCGGGEQLIDMYSPGSLVFRYNYVHKQPSWQNYVRSNNGGPYQMKNLFEFKAMDGAVIDSNVFEYNFRQQQDGFAVLFTPRLDYAPPDQHPAVTGPFLNHSVRNVQFINNTIRHTPSCFSVGLYDNSYGAGGLTPFQVLNAGGGAQNFLFRNNLCDDMDGTEWGDGIASIGWSLTVRNDIPAIRNYTQVLTVDHNTLVTGPTASVNSLSVRNTLDSVGSCNFFGGPAADQIFTYNMFAFEVGRDCATGPSALISGNVFNHNTLNISFSSQAIWDAAFPDGENIVRSTSNPDGRGANLVQLSALEALIKAGTRP